MNAYSHLEKKTRKLLLLESNLSDAEKEQNQWLLMVKVNADTRITIGKGGANTLFYQVNDGKRNLKYPMDMLDFLKQKATGKSPIVYKLYDKGQTLVDTFPSKKAVLEKAKANQSVATVNAEGKEKIAYRVQSTMLSKELQLVPIREKAK